MDIKLLDGKVKVSRYNPSFLKDKKGNVIAVSFPIDDFLELTEDIEDYAFLEGNETSKDGTTPHEEILKESGLTPEKLKDLRKKMGLTADQLGEKIGYSGGTIRNIETGQSKVSKRFEKAVKDFI